MHFVYEANPARVVFGAGSRARIPEELDRLGITRAIILSTPAQAALAGELAREIGQRAAILYPGAAMHTPVEVTQAAMNAVRSVSADGILSAGGGSTIGLGKAIAFRTDLPQLAVPTTFAGSEMTPILGQTENGVKTTLRSSKVLPETAVYDPELVVSMPPALAGTSGLNAIAHSVEALYAKDANPITSLLAEESIRALGCALPEICACPQNLSAWTDAVYGAWLAGVCLGTVGMALHHKICHTLGGMFNLDHASLHSLMLPYSAAYNREATPEAMQRVARALNVPDAPEGLYDLMQKVGTHKSLRDFGLRESDLESAAELAVKNPYYNPRPITRDDLLEMLHAAYEGKRP
ncbi:MAG TPA: maleylacetate reductase [Bryobacteraceae bacterium]|jgi:maleylacetate reductase|nr:maleylacetate reductase [Bryobacteraceae bacterium]